MEKEREREGDKDRVKSLALSTEMVKWGFIYRKEEEEREDELFSKWVLLSLLCYFLFGKGRKKRN